MEDDKKRIVSDALMRIEPIPPESDDIAPPSNSAKIPLSKFAEFGAAFTLFAEAVTNITGNGGQTLYRALDDDGHPVTNLFAKKNGKGFISSYRNSSGKLDQANLVETNPLFTCTVSPGTLFMASAMIAMQKEISEIKETQREILDFIKDEKRAELRGDLLYLSSVINDYRYNLENENYKTAARVKVQDIMQSAARNIELYSMQIARKAGKGAAIAADSAIKNDVEKLGRDFGEYRIALYLYAFSSFLNVLLLENFDKSYLDSVAEAIEDQSFKYRKLYSKCYGIIESRADKSLNTLATDAVANASRGLGKLVSKTPLLNRSQLDENLLKAHDNMEIAKDRRTGSVKSAFLVNREDKTEPFISGIRLVNRLYNDSSEILFDDKNMYVVLSA